MANITLLVNMSAGPRQVYYAALHARGLNPSEEELDLDGQSWLTEEEKIKIKEVMVREKVSIVAFSS